MWKLARNFTATTANKTRAALFPRKNKHIGIKSGKLVPNKFVLENNTRST